MEHSTQACLHIHTVTDLQSFMKSRCSFCLLRCTRKAIKTAFCFVAVSQLLLIVNCLVFFAGCVYSIISTKMICLLLCLHEQWRCIVMSTSVCLCVCLSVCLSVCDDWPSSRVMKSQGEGAVLVVFFPTDNAL